MRKHFTPYTAVILLIMILGASMSISTMPTPAAATPPVTQVDYTKITTPIPTPTKRRPMTSVSQEIAKSMLSKKLLHYNLASYQSQTKQSRRGVPTPSFTPSATFTPLPTPLSVTETSTATIAPPTQQGKALVVNQTTQVLRVYEDGEEIRSLPISTGKRLSYTPAFRGRVGHYAETLYGFGALADHAWYLTKATGNIYLHGAPYTMKGGERTYQDLDLIGIKPSSHGCIRLHPDDALWLSRWDPRNVLIIVTPPNFVRFPE